MIFNRIRRYKEREAKRRESAEGKCTCGTKWTPEHSPYCAVAIRRSKEEQADSETR